MKKGLAIIPARGGSKGILRKNLQEIGGIPLIQRTIETAQQCHHISRVVVSTDDEEIGKLAEKCKAITVYRPTKLASDTAKSEDALLHAIEKLQKHGPIEDIIIFLQCTSPFTTPEDIETVIKALTLDEINSSFAARAWHGFLWSPEGNGINHNPLEPRKRRQDLEVSLLETGSIYAMRTKEFVAKKTRFCQPTRPIVVAHNPHEIDSIEDLELCRMMHQRRLMD